MVMWFNSSMVIVIYSNQLEWIIPKRFIPIWLMFIGFYIVTVSRNCNLKYNYIDNLSLTPLTAFHMSSWLRN